MGAFAIAVLVIIVILAIWVISTQRNMVHSDELCSNALSQIGVQQNSRWDALKALAELTKGYSEHEYKTLMDVVGQRRAITGQSSAADAQAQENMLTEAMGRFMAVTEAYPDLKSNTIYLETMGNVRQYEENVRHSRMVYNDTVTKFNRMVRQIPGSFLAGSLGFSTRDYLQEPQGKTEMPSMNLSGGNGKA